MNQKIGIEAIEYIEPDQFVSSEDIENELSPIYDKLKLPYGRIEMQSGVKTRGIFPNKKPSEIATAAAQNLFNKSHIKKGDIDLLIYAGVCRDFLEPSTASAIHNNLLLNPNCESFDLSNACLGFVNSMSLAKNLISTGQYRKVLIVTGENSAPLLSGTMSRLKQDDSLTRKSIKKYFANFTIGSAGVAMVISDKNLLATIEDAKSISDTSCYSLCQGSGDMNELTMETNSEELMGKGIKLAKKCWADFKLQFRAEKLSHYICHQVGIHHRDYLYKELELDLGKDFTSFDRYGNTGSAAIVLTLAMAYGKNKFNKHDEIALLGIGSGIHTTMMRLIWQ